MNIGEELYIFLSAIWTGEVTMAGYHFLKWMIGFWRKKKSRNPVEEFLYFIGCGIYVFYCMMNACDGVIRWYFFAGLAVGELSGHIILCFFENTVKNFKKRSGNY